MIQRAANGQRPTANGQLTRESNFSAPLEEATSLPATASENSNHFSESISSPVPALENLTASCSAAFRGSNNIVFYLIAVLLLFTAIAKLWMLVTDSFADVRVGISKEILWFSVFFELSLAYFNFRQKNPAFLAKFRDHARFIAYLILPRNPATPSPVNSIKRHMCFSQR